MIDLIRKLVRSTGYDLIQYKPSRSRDLRLQLLFNTYRIDTVVDIGANAGQFAKGLRTAGFTGRILSFEPGSAAHKALSRNAAGDAQWTAMPRVAIGSEEGEASLNLSANSQSSSLMGMEELHKAAETTSVYVESETVPVKPLDAFSGEIQAEKHHVFVKVDTQGFEKEVLNGMPELIQQVRGFQLEMSLAPLYKGQAEFDELVEMMRASGFEMFGFTPGFTDPRTGRMLAVDGLFFRPMPGSQS